MTAMYMHDWGSKDDMIESFRDSIAPVTDEERASYAHVDVILASYGYANYNGDAFVLFRDTRDGKLYEVNGGHCSCYGLEGQWSPDPTDVESLRHRVTKGDLGSNDYCDNLFKTELLTILGELS